MKRVLLKALQRIVNIERLRRSVFIDKLQRTASLRPLEALFNLGDWDGFAWGEKDWG